MAHRRLAPITNERTCMKVFNMLLKKLEKKVYDLTVEFDMDALVIVFSPTGKAIFLSGNRRIEDVIDRFLNDPTAQRNEELMEKCKRMMLEKGMTVGVASNNSEKSQPPKEKLKDFFWAVMLDDAGCAPDTGVGGDGSATTSGNNGSDV